MQNTNKCPHGFPIGACPICSGMGSGVPRDKNKARKPGEMTYNECMAQWIQMQRAKDAKAKKEDGQKQLLLDKLKQENKIYQRIAQVLNKIQNIFNNAAKNISQTFNKLPPVIKTILKPAAIIIRNIMKIISFTYNFVQNSLHAVANFINSVSEKLSSLLGETKNFIKNLFDEKFLKPLKGTFKTILSLFMEQSSKEEENEKDELLKKLKIKQLAEAIFRKNEVKKGNKEKEDELI